MFVIDLSPIYELSLSPYVLAAHSLVWLYRSFMSHVAITAKYYRVGGATYFVAARVNGQCTTFDRRPSYVNSFRR